MTDASGTIENARDWLDNSGEHAIAVAKTRLARHDIDGVSTLFNHQPGSLYAQVLDGFGR